jgi:coiled-coil domain-containing protein 130
VSGARRQENRWDPKENEQVVPEDKSTSKRLFDDAMFKLEHGCGDKRQADGVQPTLAKLTAKRQKLWQDDYAANCVLRQQFRVSDSLFFEVFMHGEPLLEGSSLKCFRFCSNQLLYSLSTFYSIYALCKQVLFPQNICRHTL